MTSTARNSLRYVAGFLAFDIATFFLVLLHNQVAFALGVRFAALGWWISAAAYALIGVCWIPFLSWKSILSGDGYDKVAPFAVVFLPFIWAVLDALYAIKIS